ncbi:histone-fold-containing protein [Mycena rosella]|uniref:Histone H2A n=1 Tax=Mycena rosella TaxID=1033263 RepID=A0AAD7D033_MYCRO|nr:histone-fold-containing protein [Mycena rosella]
MINKRRTLSSRAGLVFPVGRIHRLVKDGNYAKRVSTASAVYLAAVLEYLVAELVELAGNCACDHKKIRIIPRHLLIAIRNDDEMDRLLKGTVISQGGVKPFIHSCLIPETRKANKAMSDSGSSYI